jgi:hypothetical protein
MFNKLLGLLDRFVLWAIFRERARADCGAVFRNGSVWGYCGMAGVGNPAGGGGLVFVLLELRFVNRRGCTLEGVKQTV